MWGAAGRAVPHDLDARACSCKRLAGGSRYTSALRVQALVPRPDPSRGRRGRGTSGAGWAEVVVPGFHLSCGPREAVNRTPGVTRCAPRSARCTPAGRRRFPRAGRRLSRVLPVPKLSLGSPATDMDLEDPQPVLRSELAAPRPGHHLRIRRSRVHGGDLVRWGGASPSQCMTSGKLLPQAGPTRLPAPGTPGRASSDIDDDPAVVARSPFIRLVERAYPHGVGHAL